MKEWYYFSFFLKPEDHLSSIIINWYLSKYSKHCMFENCSTPRLMEVGSIYLFINLAKCSRFQTVYRIIVIAASCKCVCFCFPKSHGN